MPDFKYLIGGIEGGGTKSTIVLLNENGEVLVETGGDSTNHYQYGMPEVWKRIAEMVENAKTKAGIPSRTKLLALGLGLSGCKLEENDSTNREFVDGLARSYPNLSDKYWVSSDSYSSICTISSSGITCIAGTGSATLLVNPDDSMFQCGGYGHLLGDEGGAYNITYTAIKFCIGHMDGFQISPHSIDWTWKAIQEYFNIQTPMELVDYIYRNFEKTFIAGFCRKLADGANTGDSLAQHVFALAGRDLAQSICAVLPKAHISLTRRCGGTHVLCVGSVWDSWTHLKSGFIAFFDECGKYSMLTLIKSTMPIAVGSAYMASDRLNVDMIKNRNQNYEVIYMYTNNKINT